MIYLTCMEASEKMNITPRRIQQMCKDGEIPGATKEGHSWRIPQNAIMNDRNADYLKVVGMYPRYDGNYICELAIPNREITFVYAKEVLNKIYTEIINFSI